VCQSPAMPGPGSFPSTHWSVVQNLARESRRTHAFGLLFETYRHPVFAYVRRRLGNADRAEDLTQAFFTHVLERRALERADRTHRFRAFLLTSLKNFVANELRRDRSRRRGGGLVTVPLSDGAAPRVPHDEPFHTLTPEALFNLHWALDQLQRALNALRRDFERRGKRDWFDELKPCLIRNRPVSCASIAERLNASEGAVRVAVHRLRKQFNALLAAEIARSVSDPLEVADEIRFLIRSLSAAGSTRARDLT
jgi:RNA polymerase sigma factor (sigma-70 family)